MRHRKKINKLGRTASHRKATLKHIATSLILHHQIRTTLAKAKAARSYVEKLITISKKDSVHARRQIFKFLQNRTLVKRLFDEVAPTFTDRKGGYTRVIKLGQRQGDGAEMAILQLVGFEQLVIDEQETKKKKRKERAEKKKKEEAAAEQEVEAVEPEKEEEPIEEKEEKKVKKTVSRKAKTKKTEKSEEKKEEPKAKKAKKTAKSEEVEKKDTKMEEVKKEEITEQEDEKKE